MQLPPLRRPVTALVAGLAIATTLGACTGKYSSDFQVVVVNRVTNTLLIFANGNQIGQVSSGQSGTFTLNLTESQANVFSNGVAPTPQSDVVLSAKDAKSGALSTTKEISVTQGSPTYVTFAAADFPSVAPTVARFTVSPTNPGINQDIIFNATTSTATNATYAWDFGDGQNGTGVNVTHRYNRAATFTVVLMVTSDNGQSSSASRTVLVSAALPPTAAAFTFSPTNPAINQSVLFTASTIDPTGGETFAWDFGDGATGSGASATHKYTRAGTYNVTLRVSNAAGQSASSARALTVSANLPGGSVNFTFSPTTPGVNDDVFFNASSTTVANASFAWDFGDGSRGTGVTTTHRYGAPDVYTVTLTVTNDLGQSASVSKTITVTATSSQVIAAFTFSPQNPVVGDTVFFDATGSSPGVTSWSWDFGDGSSGSGQRATHVYAAARTFTVRLSVSNAQGQSATVTNSVTVSGSSGQATADFTFSPTDPHAAQIVFFDGSISAPSAGATIATYVWDFGDGSTPACSTSTPTGCGAGTPQKPQHAFATANTFVVKLTITDTANKSSTVTHSVAVKP